MTSSIIFCGTTNVTKMGKNSITLTPDLGSIFFCVFIISAAVIDEDPF